MGDGPIRYPIAENFFQKPGHGQGQPRLFKPGEEELIRPHIVEPTARELARQEFEAKKAQSQKEKGTSRYIALDLIALLGRLPSLNLELPPLFQPLIHTSKGSEIDWTLAGIGVSVLGAVCLTIQHLQQVPSFGSKMRVVLKTAGILGLGVGFFLSTQEQKLEII